MSAPSPHGHHDDHHDRRSLGAGFIEYALLLALIAFALITMIDALGDDTSESIDDSASSVASFG